MDFTIEVEPVIFEQDLALHENATLNIRIGSSGFSAMTYMDVDIKDFAKFSEALYCFI